MPVNQPPPQPLKQSLSERDPATYCNYLTLGFILTGLLAQVLVDLLDNRSFDCPVLVALFVAALFLVIPTVRKMPLTPFMLVYFWSTSNFIAEYIWGQTAGFMFLGGASIVTGLMFNAAVPDARWRYFTGYQVLLLVISVTILPVTSSVYQSHPHLTEIVYTLALVYLLWISNVVLNYISLAQAKLKEERDRVTEAQKEVSRSLDLVERTGKIAKIGGWELDLTTSRVTFSKETERIHEIDADYVPPLYQTGGEWYPPEAWKVVQAAVKAAIEEAKPYDLEVPFITAKGRQIWVRTQGFPVKLDGKVIKLEGTFQDITEQKYRDMETKLITDSLGIGIWKFDPRTNELEWDKRMYALYGVDPSEFSGAYTAWENALTPEAKQAAVEELGLALAGKKDFNTTFQIQLKSGEKRFIAGRGVVMRNEKNDPIKMYGVNWDVTEQIMAQERLKESQQLVSTVLATLPMAVFAKDIKKGFQWNIWNRHAEELFGLKAEDCLGKYDSDFFPKEQADFFREKDIEASQSTGVIDIPEESANSAKGKVILHTKKIVIRDSDNQPSILLGITEDITSKKQQEKELKEAHLKLLHSSKLASLGEMAAGIAHEINNPLAVIAGSVIQIPKHANNLEKLTEKVATIERAVGRIAKIVTGLRKFSRSSDGKKTLSERTLSKIIEEVLVLTSVKAKQNNILIQTALKSESLILCDEVEIEQVLINLINNAMDAVKEREERWVRIELFDEANKVILRVIDSGKGIPESVRQKIFDPFFTTKAVGQGTGLGLSISKGILDEHGASISVLSHLPNTCFEIRFDRVEAIRAAA